MPLPEIPIEPLPAVASLMTLRVPVYEATESGEKVTVTALLLPGGTVPLVDETKNTEVLQVHVKPVKVSVLLPVFEIVSVPVAF